MMKKELIKNNYVQDIKNILKSQSTKEDIQKQLENFHENDIAEALILLNQQERIKLYDILDQKVVADVFSYIEDAKKYIEEMDQNKAADIIEKMDVDDAIDLLDDLDDDYQKELINLMEDDAKKDIVLIQSYEEDEIGSVMTTNFITIESHFTIKQAMKELVQKAAEHDNIMTLYVLKDQQFYGVIDLKDLIVARENDSLQNIMTKSYPYVYDHEAIDECMNYILDYSEDSIPVLNKDKHIIGVITSQDIVELMDEEMGEDYAKLGGLTGEEDLEETTKESIRKRLPWLLILLVLGLGVSYVVGLFETVVEQLTIIICFQSLILDMAGNVGTQSLAVTIRVLTDETLQTKELVRLIFKETRVGFCNGLLLGMISFIFIGIYIYLFKGKTIFFSYGMSACIGISLIIAMVISSMTGTAIPILFKKLGIDPAVASGPLITTINDLVAVITYYGMAWMLLIEFFHIGG